MTKQYIQTTTSFATIAEDERPREKALNQGIGALTDSELLAILFGTGMRGVSVLDMAKNILDDNDGHLCKITELTPEEFSKRYKGIGMAKALLILASLELGKRAAADAASMPDRPLSSSRQAYDLMRGRLEDLDHEEFWVAFLNNSAIVIGTEQIALGGQAATYVDIKIIMRRALENKATRIIAYHNHPSGQLKPSMQDDSLTKRIGDAAKILDIRLDDHIIISKRGYYSYNDQGRLH